MAGKTMIYGAYGYSGELIARLAVKRGHQPILAGRHPESVMRLADELGCESRFFKLEAAQVVEQNLEDIDTLLHCAGPFQRTYLPMVRACLKTGTHYLDITGEASVFEALAARDVEARDAGVMLMPGVGFDVVPSDCLALHLSQRLPSATHLTLAFIGLGRISRGTALTLAENSHRGGLVRRSGKLETVPAAWKTREIDFGPLTTTAVTIPWGDVSTAFYSTGIPNIEVYTGMPAGRRAALRLARYLGPLLGSAPIQWFLKRRIRSGSPGPTAEQRQRGQSYLWGEVTDERGARAVARIEAPDGYTLTSRTAVAILEEVAAGRAPAGYQTPAKAYGADFILGIEGIQRTDDDDATSASGDSFALPE